MHTTPCSLNEKIKYLKDRLPIISFEYIEVHSSKGLKEVINKNTIAQRLLQREMYFELELRFKGIPVKRESLAKLHENGFSEEVTYSVSKDLKRLRPERPLQLRRHIARFLLLHELLGVDIDEAADLLALDCSLTEFESKFDMRWPRHAPAKRALYATADVLLHQLQAKFMFEAGLEIMSAANLRLRVPGPTRGDGLPRAEPFSPPQGPFRPSMLIGCTFCVPKEYSIVALLAVDDAWDDGRFCRVRCLAPSANSPGWTSNGPVILPTQPYHGQFGYVAGSPEGRSDWVALLLRDDVNIELPWTTPANTIHVLSAREIEWLLDLPSTEARWIHGCYEIE